MLSNDATTNDNAAFLYLIKFIYKYKKDVVCKTFITCAVRIPIQNKYNRSLWLFHF